MSERRREIEQLEADIAAMEQQVQQIASKRAVAILRKMMLEAMEVFESTSASHQRLSTSLFVNNSEQNQQSGPKNPTADRDIIAPGCYKEGQIVDRHKLGELTRRLSPARQKAILLMVDMVETAHPLSVATTSINARIAESQVVSNSVLAKCKTALRRARLVSFNPVAQTWSLEGAASELGSQSLVGHQRDH